MEFTPYLQWMDDPNQGFWIRDAWDVKANTTTGEGKLILFPRHRRIMDKALEITPEGRFRYQTVLYSDIKKTAKTALSASVGAWYAEVSRPGTEIYVIANSLEQGEGRVMRDLKFHFEKRLLEKGSGYCKIGQYKIELHNGTFIQVLAQSFRSAAGSRHALTLWDELWGATGEFDRRMWDEMVPIPTIPMSLRWVSSYAGFENESELLWDLYLSGVGTDEHPKGKGTPLEGMEDLPIWTNGDTITYWSHESDLPWYTKEYLDKQAEHERPAAFLRLFLNQWVTSHEEFIPVEWWDRAAKAYEGPATLWIQHPFSTFPITIAVDAGIRKDSTALVGVGYESSRGKLGVVFHKIWKPSSGDPVDLEATVEKELIALYNRFNIASIVYDPTHLLTIMMRLSRLGLPTKVFDQTVPNMTSASQVLYDLLKSNNLEAYPDDELRRHIQMSVAETTARGFRIVKTKSRRTHFIDGAIALAMACHECVSNGGVDISVPVIIESPFSDATTLRPQLERDLPWALQS